MSQTARIIQFKQVNKVEDSSNENIVAGGYIRLHRSLQESSFSNKAEYLATWVHMLMLATHKPRKTMMGKLSVHLMAGQFVSGRKALAEMVGTSEQSMRTIISFFEQEGMISKSSNRSGTVFSVLNFCSFQGKKINQPSTNINNQPINQAEAPILKGSSDIATNLSTNGQPSKSTTTQENNNKPKDIKDTVGKPDDKPDCIEVISYLNEKASKGFKNTAANFKYIKGRLKDGHSVEDLKAVIDHKFLEWGSDRKMCAYLRPQTLFGASNFEGYLSVAHIEPVQQQYFDQPSNAIDWDDKSWAEDLDGGLI